ncbi:membrane hypothetical protein [Candidatus Xenohaliotis californiensis]|uniref:Type IV secretion system protein VirB2 n=1 Tax=Candidatus Xenohaliotis californiensis TaxID=84677 RepID=A0ABM9N7W2_9RICK|nr:membrane hypothetical protein [Candidatus Xenohaliotis californiensis]
MHINKKSMLNILIVYVLLLPCVSIAGQGMQIPNESIDNGAIVVTICKAINIFTGPTGQALVVIVIIITGISMFFGKMTWIMAAVVMVGIGIVFGAENIVNNLIGGALNCKYYIDINITR